MTRYLHSLSAFLFYLLGLSAFVSYVLLHNSIADPWPGFILLVVKMPLVLTGLIYGGISVYRSLTIGEDGGSTALASLITVPVIVLLLLTLFLNFRDVILL